MAIIITIFKIYVIGFVIVILVSCFFFWGDFQEIKISESKRLKNVIANLVVESAKWPLLIYLLIEVGCSKCHLIQKMLKTFHALWRKVER